MQPITSLLLVIKARHEAASALAHTMIGWLEQRGVSARAVTATPHAKDLHKALPGVQAVVVLGGDGTLVGVARKLVETHLPILGVNFGKVGFLTEVSTKNWEGAFTRLLEGRMAVADRLVLHWSVLRRTQGEKVGEAPAEHEVSPHGDAGYAVNDIVVGRGPVARVLPLHVRINGQNVGWVRADGLIVSTPLGTTGYAMSAGASLVLPEVEAMVITAISPFLSRFPSMVLPGTSRIELEVDKAMPEAFLTVDGQDGVPLAGGDIIAVRGVPQGVQLLQPNASAYFQRMHRCGFIQAARKHEGLPHV